MKQLLLIAALAMIGFTANAQWGRFHNDSPCTLEFREICYDVTTAPSCTPVAISGWVVVPPFMHVPTGLTGCLPPNETGWEVRYAGTTGCAGSVTVKGPIPCNGAPHDDQLPPCSCNPSGAGLIIHANHHNVHVHPM